MKDLEPAIDHYVSASELTEREFTKLSPPAVAMVKEGQSCGELIEQLLHAQLLEDALEFIGHALPVRHSIWWGCCCIADVTPPASMNERDRKAFSATFRWVVEPTELHREYVHRLTRIVGTISAPVMLARAAGFPSMPLPEPLISLKREFRKEGAISAVNLATLEGEEVDLVQRRFIKIGLDVSQGKIVWKKPTTGVEHE
ncbi:hypothetical protein Pan216_09690 [Planctomycetes bacterium Pan216]|uniref:Uncharacterized protein n=1 Tax=Kolteria novifilia TaxID=2527975 RepID=A0A518AZJ6_9BACT|nr:hypothetical protein Pan216_09690 [Planctomycetes bacterium Pan216]